MENIRISVVCPVYNAFSFLESAIRSVLTQTHEDWELLIVDDGSTDGSSTLCESLSAFDSRIRLFRQPNSGVSAARNLALDNASGQYVTFLDADDLLHPDALSTMAKLAADTSADIISTHITKFKDSSSQNIIHPRLQMPENIAILTPEAAVGDMLYQNHIDNSVCGKLFRASLWKDNRFREGIRYEDLEVCPKIFLDARKIVHADIPLYLYRRHPGSFIHTPGASRKDAVTVTASLTDYMAARYPSLVNAALSREFSANFNLLNLLTVNPAYSDTATADKCMNRIRELRWRVILDPHTRIKNKAGAVISFLGKGVLAILAKISRKPL